MNLFRIISRIDLKNEFVVKGFHLEGWRKVGDPLTLANNYYDNNIDEIFFIDSVASLFSREKIIDILKNVCREIFIPITIGGGIKNLNDVNDLFNFGADKVAINTAAILEPDFIKKIANVYGSQAVIVSIQAKKNYKNSWDVFIDSARENTKIDVFEWVKKAERLGAGELLITSIDNEGCGNGFDTELCRKVKSVTNLPIIIGGGFGDSNHIAAIKDYNLSGASIASAFHYNKISPKTLKNQIEKIGFKIR
tara:strand:+ start:1387 stop:2139 length:753 start_codon:yes stop_codon:yes gene_type:complete